MASCGRAAPEWDSPCARGATTRNDFGNVCVCECVCVCVCGGDGGSGGRGGLVLARCCAKGDISALIWQWLRS